MTTKIAKEMEKYRQETQKALDETIEDTIRQAAIPNSLAWVGVVVGSFVLNLLLLVIVSGG